MDIVQHLVVAVLKVIDLGCFTFAACYRKTESPPITTALDLRRPE